jgi:hypothetical protein
MTPATKAVREKLAANDLPNTVPVRARLLRADGQHCAGCDLPIKVGQQMWELEFSGGLDVRLHEDCEQIWRQETGN